MKTIKLVLSGLLAVLLGHSTTSLAADIDIYSGLSGAAGKPNVLIVFDNAANFSSNAAGSTCVIDGVATALSGTVGGIEQCAFYSVINSLPNGVVNIGMMVYNENGMSDWNGGVAGTDNCTGSNGGCLVVPLTEMTAASKPALLAWIKTWVTSGATGYNIKSNGEATAAAIQEAWAYYAGSTGLSGRDYAGVKPTAGCQQNFVIFIGNSYGAAGTPGDPNSTPAANLASHTGADTTLITTTHTTTCGTYTFPSSAHENKGFYADEWTRYMRQSDLYSDVTETQKITTYTIGLLGASCQAEYAALLTSMANVGGGKYFATTDYSSITQALLKILNEVQAVNSVFSSSSLPVSVNAQGTYLNQIYMGMFRPDSGGYPRWVGNLKQYQFIYDPTANSGTGGLSMGDSLGISAISASGTGFISSNAVSYWTCGGSPVVRACSADAGDVANGFWQNQQQGAGGAYDSPDGELVEKGGAAQIMRLANKVADFTAAAGYPASSYTTNPRQLYTYCPTGASCEPTLRHDTNTFETGNGGITATMFGASSSLRVSSISRTGTTALVTTSEAHGFADGSSVTISGATQPEYNVTQNITTPSSATTFTITGLPDYPTTPSTGAYTAALHNSATKVITGVSVATSTTANANACTSGTIPNINCVRVTVTSAGHGYSDTNNVVIAGVSPAQYSGAFTIANVTTDTFTYDVPVTPKSPSVNAYSVKLPTPASKTVTEIKKVTGNCTVFATAHGYSNGASVTISGNTDWNGTYTVASAAANTFQIALNCNSTGTGGNVVLDTPTISIAAGNISRASATATTATAVAASAVTHNATYTLAYVSGSGSNESQYVTSGGSRSVVVTCSSGATCTTFTFPLDTTVFSTTLTTSSPTVALSGAPVTIAAGKITRSGTTATVTNVAAASAFATGQYIDIGVSGASVGTESAYLSPANGWQITCHAAGCDTSFTFGPVTLTPATPATGSSITAYQGSTPPAKDPLISWVRGQDNFGDELSLCPPGTAAGTNNCPDPAVTVRPSFHGDVLHSRPVVINYGGSIGVIVYYGANDGVYRAINGNQTNPSGSTLPIPGSELWGFIPTEFFNKLNRQRTNSPQLNLPTTPAGILPTPESKNYFADGATGIYQLMDANGTTLKAILYLAMRRGGRFVYALDVTTPTDPKLLWKIDPDGLVTGDPFLVTASTDYEELGETWSAPKVASIDGYSNPVLIFGGGYDSVAEDTEPPTANSMGRAIFIVDAMTGALVWRATPTSGSDCSNTAAVNDAALQATCLVSGMDYSIPADITLVDRDGNGKIDRLYAVDVGGNVWRVDLRPTATHTTPKYWQVNKLAALGCPNGIVTTDGVCSVGPPRVTPGKFFYPADVVTTSSYDAVLVGQGDREHPLYDSDAAIVKAYDIQNRFFMLRDINTNANTSIIDHDGSNLTLITPSKLLNQTPTVVTAGSLVVGNRYTILTIGTTNFVSIGAAANTVGITFTATGAGAGTGTANTYVPYEVTSASSAVAPAVAITPNLGYYINLGAGEKVVNAPTTVAGYTYFGTNQPVAPSANTCSANLGIARGYKVGPLGGTFTSSTFAGGGLPPTPVAGLVNVDVTVNGVTTTKLVPFIIGGGGDPGCSGPDCVSALGGGKPTISVPTSRTRTYWYQEVD